MRTKFPDKRQRSAVCYSQYRGHSEPAPEELVVRAFRTAVSLTNVLVVPAGSVHSKNGDFVADKEAFELIRKAFDAHGADLPIDYEHQTLGGKYASPDGKAPAAGWIKSIEFDADRGIVASVEWTEAARKMIQSGEYAYMSPVVLVRKSDQRAIELHSVALTNKPAIARLERLVAKEMGIMPKDKVTNATAHQDGAVEGMGDPMLALARIAEAMGLSDVPNDAAAIAEAVLAEIRKMKAGEGDGGSADGGDAADAAAAKENMSKIATRLGAAKDATVDVIVAKIDEMRSTTVNADKYEALQTKVAALEKQELDRVVNAEIAKATDEGKINPKDGEQMEWARKVCAESPENFRALMSKAPKAWAGTGAAAAQGKTEPTTTRSAMIERHRSEWLANREQHPAEQTDLAEHVSGALMYDGYEGLTKAERTALTAKETK